MVLRVCLWTPILDAHSDEEERLLLAFGNRSFDGHSEAQPTD